MTEIIQVDDNTWRIEDGFVRFFLLTGTEKAVLIDTGFDTPNAKEIAEKYTDLPLLLMNTHGDGDHCSGTGDFSEIYIGEEDYINCGLKDRFPQTKPVALTDGMVIELGGRTLKIITIPGHTAGSVAILDVEKRVLYAGDSVQSGQIFMFGDKRMPEQFQASLEKLIALSDAYDTIMASHDNCVLGGDYAKKVLEDWQKVQAGELSYTEENMHGATVKSYRGDYCGFFL